MTDYHDRIRGVINLISPDGKEFNPKWIGDNRNKSKKLGIYNYAKVKGTIVQDLGMTSGTYPLTLYFDGADNDKDAESFWNACDEDGEWEVIHPTKGFKGLQLMKVSEVVAPVTDAGYTLFQSEWIEPIDPETLKTTAQLAAEAGRALNEFNGVSADRFFDRVKDGSFADRAGLTGAVDKITTAMDTILGPIAGTVDGINSAFDETLRGVQDVLEATILDPLALAAQIQQLSQLPALALRDIKSRLNAYADLFTEIARIQPDRADDPGINVALAKEVAYSGMIGALSIISTTAISQQEEAETQGQTTTGVVLDIVTQIPVTNNLGAVQTQAQIIEAIEAIAAQNMAMVDDLDESMELFEDNTIDEQYFSQTETFAAAMNLTAIGQEYLLQNFYNLKIEKVFFLKRPKTPVQVTIEEYGTIGINDSNLALFLSSNQIKGNENILMPTGKELVSYA